MKIYYLVNPENGWDNVCGMSTTIKGLYEHYYDEEPLDTDEECTNRFKKERLALLTRFIND